MTKNELKKFLGYGEYEPHLFGDDNKLVTLEELVSHNNFIVYGEERADTFVTFVTFCENQNELNNKVIELLNGNTGCDFCITIFLIVQDGIKKEISGITLT